MRKRSRLDKEARALILECPIVSKIDNFKPEQR